MYGEGQVSRDLIGALMRVSWSGLKVVAGSGAVVGDFGQGLRCGSYGGSGRPRCHSGGFLVRSPGVGAGVGGISWSSPPKSGL